MIRVGKVNLAVDGTVTAQLKSGKHFTYRIRTARKGALEGKRIVDLLSGPDNESSYVAFGFVNEFHATVGGQGTEDIPPSYHISVWYRFRNEAFRKHAQLLMGQAQDQVQIWFQAGKCQRCGRKLTTPESIERGVGPVCSGRG